MSDATGSDATEDRKVTFDRHLVLDQLGGWRGMVDATLPTIAFVVANSLGGLRPGIWTALAAAVLVFGLRLARRQSVQQGISGLFAVAVAVAIAWRTGEARDFFTLGLIRNAGIGVVLLGSILFRWPLVGVVAEFLAPSHLGALATHSLPSLKGLRSRRGTSTPAATPAPAPAAAPAAAADAAGDVDAPVDDGVRAPDPEPERHWRDDPRLVRAYSWLTLLWGGVFLLRAAVTWFFYLRDDVEALGAASVVLGLPVTAVQLAITLWVVARLHRHRTEQ